jgi:hypothetical protein
MVHTGQPSRGCAVCRRRKIKVRPHRPLCSTSILYRQLRSVTKRRLGAHTALRLSRNALGTRASSTWHGGTKPRLPESTSSDDYEQLSMPDLEKIHSNGYYRLRCVCAQTCTSRVQDQFRLQGLWMILRSSLWASSLPSMPPQTPILWIHVNTSTS